IIRRLQGEASLLVAPEEGAPVEPVERPDRFLVRKLGREFLVAAADIEYLQASGNYVNLHVRGRDYPLRSTIAGIEPKLDPKRFVRVHRSYIVNIDAITSIEPLDTGDARLHLANALTIPCSRRYRAQLRELAGAIPEPGDRDVA
ncbi:MAG: LytTR family DNA-binding domain-containing protein, partial [Dokdonella sp.]